MSYASGTNKPNLVDLTTRVANLEKHVQLLYEENKELKECNCRIGKAIGLSQKQQDQLNGYHQGHEEQQGYDHFKDGSDRL